MALDVMRNRLARYQLETQARKQYGLKNPKKRSPLRKAGYVERTGK